MVSRLNRPTCIYSVHNHIEKLFFSPLNFGIFICRCPENRKIYNKIGNLTNAYWLASLTIHLVWAVPMHAPICLQIAMSGTCFPARKLLSVWGEEVFGFLCPAMLGHYVFDRQKPCLQVSHGIINDKFS